MTQNIFSILKILCALPIHPSMTPTTDLFIVLIVLPFSECHILGIIQRVASSDRLLSLTNMQFKVSLCLFMA